MLDVNMGRQLPQSQTPYTAGQKMGTLWTHSCFWFEEMNGHIVSMDIERVMFLNR